MRPATQEDRDFVLGLVRRFVEFGVPPWHERPGIVAAVERSLAGSIDHLAEDPSLMVAEDEASGRLGFIRLETRSDHFTAERLGYVSEIAVGDGGGGRGVGRALMEAGEAWARDRGYRLLTLDVFAGNGRARSFYRRLGYSEDSLSMAKEL